MTMAFEILRGFGVKGQAGFVEAVRKYGKHTQSGSVISTKPEEVREANDRGRVERSRGSKSFHDDAGNSPGKPFQKHPQSGENTSWRHGRGRIVGAFRLVGSRCAPSDSLKVTGAIDL
jgi:hypothetical protein